MAACSLSPGFIFSVSLPCKRATMRSSRTVSQALRRRVVSSRHSCSSSSECDIVGYPFWLGTHSRAGTSPIGVHLAPEGTLSPVILRCAQNDRRGDHFLGKN